MTRRRFGAALAGAVGVAGLTLGALAGAGCSGMGPSSLRLSHRGYNDSIARAMNEQLLLNLIRLRYRETPFFLDVGSVTSQQTLSGTAALGLELGLAAATGTARPNLGMGYSVTPTLVFAPLQGEAFVRKLMTPIQFAGFLLSTQSGWSVHRVLSLVADRISGLPNAPSATGPTPMSAPRFRDFKRLVADLRTLQRAGMLSLSCEPGTPAGREGPVVLEVRAEPEHQRATERVQSALAAPPGTLRYRLLLGAPPAPPGRPSPPPGAASSPSDPPIGLQLRSLLGVLFYLSQAVRVPEAHEAAHVVTVTKNPDGSRFGWGELFDDLFRVETQPREPDAAYVKVSYRGHWFFVRDDDLESKSTFMLLSHLFALQAGQVNLAMPTLTLPVGP